MDNYKVDDFEVVKELEPVNGCALCWFSQVVVEHNKQCQVMAYPAGMALEVRYGGCENGHHYRLKERSELHARDRYAVADEITRRINKQ